MRKLVIWHFLVAIVIANVKCNFLKYTSLSYIISYISFSPILLLYFSSNRQSRQSRQITTYSFTTRG